MKKYQESIQMIEKIDIYIKNQTPLRDLSKIINNSKNEKAEKWTKIILHIQEGENERLLDLGAHFLIYPIEKKRIIETIGVLKVE